MQSVSIRNEKSVNPLVSIITPSYNQGIFIRQTIDSVLNQSYKNIEYWIIDGGSTDETLEILNSYGSAINYVSEKDQGQANAINKGILKTNGEIIGFVNSDDYLNPAAIQKIVEAFQRTNSLWVTGDYCIVDESSIRIQSFIVRYKRLLRKFSNKSLFQVANYIAQPSTFWHRELITKIGLFDESLQFVMDYDYWLRAFAIAPPVILADELSAFRIHKLSKGGSQYIRQFDEELRILKKYTQNPMILFLHKQHNNLIKAAYRIIK